MLPNSAFFFNYFWLKSGALKCHPVCAARNDGIHEAGENPHTAIITIWVFEVTFEIQLDI